MLNIYDQLVIAGLDTVEERRSAYSLFHLATHDTDRQWIVDEPSIISNAVEETSAVTRSSPKDERSARTSTSTGCQLRKGEMVMLLMPAAIRDQRSVRTADEIHFDRRRTTSSPSAPALHRCLGSHLARMEMAVGLEEWQPAHSRVPARRPSRRSSNEADSSGSVPCPSVGPGPGS